MKEKFLGDATVLRLEPISQLLLQSDFTARGLSTSMQSSFSNRRSSMLTTHPSLWKSGLRRNKSRYTYSTKESDLALLCVCVTEQCKKRCVWLFPSAVHCVVPLRSLCCSICTKELCFMSSYSQEVVTANHRNAVSAQHDVSPRLKDRRYMGSELWSLFHQPS